MRIAYFPNQVALNSKPVLDAVFQSCSSAGLIPVADSMDADMAIIWSVLWHGRMTKNQQVYDYYTRSGRPVIIADIGTLIRGTTWKIALNNITSAGYYGHTENLDWDRPAKLNIHLNQSSGKHILIAAQHQNSLQVAGLNINNWIAQQIDQVKQYTDRPIVVRPHPRCRLNLSNLTGITIETPAKLANTYDSFDINYQCHAVVSYNSGPGIQAAIAGARPITDFTSLAYPVSVSIEDIEKPYLVDREKWLVEICHTEYTIEEIAAGLWIKRLNLQ